MVPSSFKPTFDNYYRQFGSAEIEEENMFGLVLERDLSSVMKDPLIKHYAVANHFLDYNMSLRRTRLVLKTKFLFKDLFKRKPKHERAAKRAAKKENKQKLKKAKRQSKLAKKAMRRARRSKQL